jgi:5-methylcytosine-specific restriction protein A
MTTLTFTAGSAILRVLSDRHRNAIADLDLEPVSAFNAWIGIEDEIELASRSQIDPNTLRTISNDLDDTALEGQREERRLKLRRRAAWLADKFVSARRRKNELFCDECKFDPATRTELAGVSARSLLDVHHKNPLEEGIRYTNVADFALLCPTCHRIEHALMRTRIRVA